MTAEAIREQIASAVALERNTGALRQLLEPQLIQLRERLLLPVEHAVETLVEFVIEYVEAIPIALAPVTRDPGAPGPGALLQRLEFFLLPAGTPDEEAGLAEVLKRAFLVHRLLEELNDHHVRQFQRPLLPLDMTEANIIVHHLLGDESAVRLEQQVDDAVATELHKLLAWVKTCYREEDASAAAGMNMSHKFRDTGVHLRLGC